MQVLRPDLTIDFLKLRHGIAARLIRSVLSRWLAGRNSWPLVFRAPADGAPAPPGESSNIYVHLPFCRQICPHCPYNKVLLQPDLVRSYGLALEREVTAYLGRTGVPPVETLYFGGGTPSETPQLVEKIIERFHSRLVPRAEIGVEVHPADAKPALLERLHAAGVNRISLGIETFSPGLLRKLARRYTPEQATEAIVNARSAGFGCVDVNLIHGIPEQSPQDALNDARHCIDLDVDQISAYPLFDFACTPFGDKARIRKQGEFERLRAQKWISAACRESGLARSSVWSFTRPELSPYSTVTHEEYVGFGAGAGSKVAGVFTFNTFSVAEYANCSQPRSALVMEIDERLRRLHWLYWSIYRLHIDADEYRRLFDRRLRDDFGLLLDLLRLAGMARTIDGGWTITETGAIWVHRLQSLYSLTYIDDLWIHFQQ